MSSLERHPDTHQPFKSLHEFDRMAEKNARLAAGLPAYDMDDPERPFTEEYDPPKNINVAAPIAEAFQGGAAAQTDGEPLIEDTSPSADARKLYARPSTAELHKIRVLRVKEENLKPAREAVDAARRARIEKYGELDI